MRTAPKIVIGVAAVAAIVALVAFRGSENTEAVPVARPSAAPLAKTPEALRDAVRAAFENRSVPDWLASVELDKVSQTEIDLLDRTLRQMFSVKPALVSLEVEALPADFDPAQVAAGRRYALTLKPEGVLRLVFRAVNADNVLLLPYGKSGDGYRLATLHGESLGWKGPDDRAFFVKVKHTGAPGDIVVVIRYNASGVDLVKRVGGLTPNITFPAQYVDSVEVVRKDDSTGSTILDISCQGTGDANDVKSVYVSPTLDKPGTILFERKKPDAGKAH